MEKFGIFNILSALNKLTGADAQKKEEKPFPPPGGKSAPTGGVFAPPSAPPSFAAMLDIMNKHTEISKRIDERMKKQ